jgi:uncharacterized protein with HEPN domain
MSRSARILLEDILESIGRIETYVEGVSKADFENDTEKQDALVRRLEIFGQAVKGLPQDLRDLHPQVPWREIAGARDILAHEYFRVDLDLAWDMIQHNVPELKRNVGEILADMIE